MSTACPHKRPAPGDPEPAQSGTHRFHLPRFLTPESLTPRTLRGRVVALAVVAAGVWIVLLTVVFNAVFTSIMAAQVRTDLKVRAESVASTVSVAPDGSVRVNDAQGDTASDTNTWVFAGKYLIEGPSNPTPWTMDARALAASGVQFVSVDDDEDAWLYAQPVPATGSQQATVVVAEPKDVYERTEEFALVGTCFLGLALLAVVAFVVRGAVQHALLPVEEMIDQADSWSNADGTQRFGAQERPVELERLAVTLDRLLDRVSAALRHEQLFTAQISHELRTPLAAMVAEVSLLRADPRVDSETAEGLARVADSTQRLTGIVDTLLRSASAKGGPRGRSDLGSVVRAVVDRTSGMAGATVSDRCTDGPAVMVEVPGDLWVGVDAAMLERIVAPVMENAYRFARHEVRIRASSSPGEGSAPAIVRLTVYNDGPALSESAVVHAFEPGWHESGDGDGDGGGGGDGDGGGGGGGDGGDRPAAHHGLGLALARRLAASAGAQISVTPPVDGVGAEFRLDLPAA